jgi:hypothetical protein
MDPEQALRDARAACEHWAHGERGDYDLVAFDNLVNAFEALDQWLSNGGFLPRDWQRKNVL